MRPFFVTIIAILFLMNYKVSAQEKYDASTTNSWIWPSRTINVSWINPSANDVQERRWVEEKIKETWEKESGLKFIWVNANENKGRGIRIKIADEWPHTKGLGRECGSYDTSMVLNFTFYNWSPASDARVKQDKRFYIEAIALHEFGHAIGFSHEHTRPDCPPCDKRQRGPDHPGDWAITPCDIYSVMNYCNPKWANHGMLSQGDIAGVRALYGLPRNQDHLAPEIELVSSKQDFVDVNNQPLKSIVKVFLRGKDGKLLRVRNVIYRLDNNFNPNQIQSISAENNFAFQFELSTSINFEVRADIRFEDGTIQTLFKSFKYELNMPTHKNPDAVQVTARRVACQHQIPCQHKIFKEVQSTCTHRVSCQHFGSSQRLTWHTSDQSNTSSSGPQHQYDLQHQYDITTFTNFEHQYDFQHEYDTVKY